MIQINKINESWIHITGDTDDILNINDYFAYYSPNYRWSPLFKSGVWDGRVRVFKIKTGLFPQGLYDRLLHFCDQTNIEFITNYTKNSLKLTEQNIIDYWAKKLKMSHIPRYYQTDSIIQSFKQSKLIVKSPTASGKSAIMYAITKLFQQIYGGQVLIIVPSIGLVSQMKGDYVEYAENLENDGADDILEIYSGQERDWEKPIIISTWQSLQNITDMSIFQRFKCILVDEVFSAETAKQIQHIIGHCTNASMKVGLAGTLNDEKINTIQLEGLFGHTFQGTTTKRLMDEGILARLKIKIMILNYKKDVRRTLYKSNFHNEMTALQNIEPRFNFIRSMTKKIDKNVLVIFKNIAYGKSLFKKITADNPDRKVYYVAGETKAKIREETRHLTIADKNAIIVASLGVFAIGVNIPNLDYIIYGQNFKSKIKVLQSIGRTLRKTATKTEAFLIDIVDNLMWKRRKNHALKHAFERIKIYDSERFQYDIKEIQM